MFGPRPVVAVSRSCCCAVLVVAFTGRLRRCMTGTQLCWTRSHPWWLPLGAMPPSLSSAAPLLEFGPPVFRNSVPSRA